MSKVDITRLQREIDELARYPFLSTAPRREISGR